MPSFAQFQLLYDQYERDCSFKSYHDYSHPAYNEIVSYGKDAIPFLLKNIDHSWLPMMALQEILADNQPYIPEKYWGNHKALKEIWLKWAEENGYDKYMVLF